MTPFSAIACRVPNLCPSRDPGQHMDRVSESFMKLQGDAYDLRLLVKHACIYSFNRIFFIS